MNFNQLSYSTNKAMYQTNIGLTYSQNEGMYKQEKNSHGFLNELKIIYKDLERASKNAINLFIETDSKIKKLFNEVIKLFIEVVFKVVDGSVKAINKFSQENISQLFNRVKRSTEVVRQFSIGYTLYMFGLYIKKDGSLAEITRY